MRIAIFTDSYKPQVNGVVTSINLFSQELRKRGHIVYIVAPESPGYSAKEKYVTRLKSIKFANYEGYRIGLPFGLMLKNFPDIDIVHVNSPFSIGLAGLAFARHRKIPCVMTFHTMYSEYTHYLSTIKTISGSKKINKIFKDISWKYLKWFHNKADVIIAPSAYIRNILIKKGIDKPVFVVPTGYRSRGIMQTKAALRKIHGFGGKDRIVLHVGRITKEKNIEFIINSLRHILKDNTKLVIASDGPMRESLQKKTAEMKLDKNVLFTGYLTEKDLEEYYKLSDVFVMASSTETQGLVLVEAAIRRLPLVVIDEPVISDFVRLNHVGLVAQKNQFAAAVEKILANAALRRKFAVNCIKIIEDYKPAKCTDRLLEVYDAAVR